MIEWYNILQENLLLDFAEDETDDDTDAAKSEDN
jgi:hypothetical protein